MKKNKRWYLPLVFSVLIGACTADAYNVTSKSSKEEEENKPLSETWSAIPEDFNCLNVVYYVPADMDTLMLWHKRLSGITLNTQKFFKDNMQLHRFDKTFGLVVNDSNQNYIQISYVKSKLEASKMNQKNMQVMANEVMDYFKANPDKKTSNHFLVYMPEYKGAFFDCAYLDPSGSGVFDHAMAFAGCDTEKFDSKFLKSANGRKTYLKATGRVMYELMHAFLQDDNNGSALLTRYSLGGYVDLKSGRKANYEQYYLDMDKVNLTPVDAMWLNQIQVFNKKEEHVYKPLSEVKIERVWSFWIDSEEYIAERDSLVVVCHFRTSEELAGAVLYFDPWRSSEVSDKDPNARTGGDAMAFCRSKDQIVELGDGSYQAVFFTRWSDSHVMNTRDNTTDPTLVDDPATPLKETNNICKAEIRFRFIAKGGMAYPQPGISLKGDWGSAYRTYFQIRRYWNGVMFGVDKIELFAPDLVERYQVK